jgi:hypothetical protein
MKMDGIQRPLGVGVAHLVPHAPGPASALSARYLLLGHLANDSTKRHAELERAVDKA